MFSHVKSIALFLCMAPLTMALPGSTTSPNGHSNNNNPGKPIAQRSAAEVIAVLNLIPNVEKGYFIESFRDTYAPANNRSASTAIYYLLESSVGWSEWHRVTDAAEVWHYYAGAPLTLSLSTDDGSPLRNVVLGPDLFRGERPQVVVQSGEWQRARSLGKQAGWTLVGTTVAPGFEVSGFELAPPGWVPNSTLN